MMQTQARIHLGSRCMGKIKIRLTDDLRVLPTSLLFTNLPPHSSRPRTQGLHETRGLSEFFLESGAPHPSPGSFSFNTCVHSSTQPLVPHHCCRSSTQPARPTPPTPQGHPQLSDLGSHPSNVKTRRANLPQCLSIRGHLWLMPNLLILRHFYSF